MYFGCLVGRPTGWRARIHKFSGKSTKPTARSHRTAPLLQSPTRRCQCKQENSTQLVSEFRCQAVGSSAGVSGQQIPTLASPQTIAVVVVVAICGNYHISIDEHNHRHQQQTLSLDWPQNAIVIHLTGGSPLPRLPARQSVSQSVGRSVRPLNCMLVCRLVQAREKTVRFVWFALRREIVFVGWACRLLAANTNQIVCSVVSSSQRNWTNSGSGNQTNDKSAGLPLESQCHKANATSQ